MPSGVDLDDPKGFSERRRLAEASDTEVDDALQKLLSGGYDEPADAVSEDAEPEDEDSQDDTGPDSGSEDPKSPST